MLPMCGMIFLKEGCLFNIETDMVATVDLPKLGEVQLIWARDQQDQSITRDAGGNEIIYISK